MSESSKIKVYLAGPEVFWPDAAELFAEKQRLCIARGLIPLTPVDQPAPEGSVSLEDARRQHAYRIYRGNLDLLNRADAVIANTTPFRGPHMDPGTAFEIGFAVARRLPLACYTQDAADLVERAGSAHHIAGPLCATGFFVEDFGMHENLMIESALELTGGHTVRRSVSQRDRLRCNDGFEEALDQLMSRLSGPWFQANKS